MWILICKLNFFLTVWHLISTTLYQKRYTEIIIALHTWIKEICVMLFVDYNSFLIFIYSHSASHSDFTCYYLFCYFKFYQFSIILLMVFLIACLDCCLDCLLVLSDWLLNWFWVSVAQVTDLCLIVSCLAFTTICLSLPLPLLFFYRLSSEAGSSGHLRLFCLCWTVSLLTHALVPCLCC